MTRKIGFTGTRGSLPTPQWQVLQSVMRELWGPRDSPECELHHGDCKGADAEADAIASRWDWRIVIHPPDVPTHRANLKGHEVRRTLPYLHRNHAIVDETEILIACPPGPEDDDPHSGTWATVRYARKLSRPITIVWPDGSVTKEKQP